MALEKVTFNRSDWSGRQETMEVDREEMTFKLMGYDFYLQRIGNLDAEADGETIYSIRGHHWACDAFGSVFVESNGVAEAVSGEMGAAARHSSDPFIAAAKLLCNFI